MDIHKVLISKAYIILIRLEAYIKTRKKSKHLINKIIHRRDKVVKPEVVAKREEDKIDNSKSA